MNDRNDILAVIPTYNNEKTVARVIADVRRYCAHVLVVNDGSTDSTAQILAAEGKRQSVTEWMLLRYQITLARVCVRILNTLNICKDV